MKGRTYQHVQIEHEEREGGMKDDEGVFQALIDTSHCISRKDSQCDWRPDVVYARITLRSSGNVTQVGCQAGIVIDLQPRMLRLLLVVTKMLKRCQIPPGLVSNAIII